MNPATYEQAIKGDKRGIWVYRASKKLAERAAFDYAKEHPGLKNTIINPKCKITEAITFPMPFCSTRRISIFHFRTA